MSTITRRTIPAIIVAGLMALTMTACVAGENSKNDGAPAEGSEWSTSTLSIDWATYNPLSLVVKDQGLIEEALGESVEVEVKGEQRNLRIFRLI